MTRPSLGLTPHRKTLHALNDDFLNQQVARDSEEGE